MDFAHSHEAQRAVALRRLSLLAAQLPSEHSEASRSRSVFGSPAAAAPAASTIYESVTSEPSSYARHGCLELPKQQLSQLNKNGMEYTILEQGLLQGSRRGFQRASAVEAGPCGAPK